MAKVASARCLCGFTNFGVRVDRTQAVLPRWRPMPSQGETLQWGRFDVVVTRGVASTCCLSCQRMRRSMPVGGGTAMTSVVGEGVVDVVMADVVDGACMTARYEFSQWVIDVPIEVIGEVPAGVGDPLELSEMLPANAVAATHVYRVPIPEITTRAGSYKLVLVDHCLGIRQVVRDVELTVDLASVYDRGGDVVVRYGIYPASYIDTEVEGVSLADDFDLLYAAIQDRAQTHGDLGGTGSAPRVTGLQGRAVKDEEPADSMLLAWSAANQRWEPKYQ